MNNRAESIDYLCPHLGESGGCDGNKRATTALLSGGRYKELVGSSKIEKKERKDMKKLSSLWHWAQVMAGVHDWLRMRWQRC